MSGVSEAVSLNFQDQLLGSAAAVHELRESDGLLLDNILSGQTYYRKASLENPLSDLSFYLSILDSGSAGFAYHNGAPTQGEKVRNLINRNALDVLATEEGLDFPLRTSILDAVYGEYNRVFDHRPDQVLVQSGSYQDKANFRSQLVTERLSAGRRVLLVGLVTEFVRDMVARDVEVSISDMSPELIGVEIHGIPVVNKGNEWTLGQLAVCDAAIVTGAAFATNTIDTILDTAKANDTELHFYLETGSNFAPHLIDRGAKSVVAEKFPFYDLPGETQFEVYER
jgi:putative heavy-metal chelation protein